MAEARRDEITKLEALYAANPGGRVFAHLAEAYRKAGEPERAREVLESGLRRHPEAATGYVVLGRLEYDSGSSEAVAAAFRRVLELDGGNLVARRYLAELALVTGNVAEAQNHFRELLSRDPSDERLQERLAELLAGERTSPESPAPVLAAVPLPAEVAEPAEAAEPEPASEEAPAVAGTNAEPWAWAGDVVFEETPPDLPGDIGLLTSAAFRLPRPEPESEMPVTAAPELMTETMAELYRSQGFLARAADVYRSLLQQAPGDERLLARLAEVEAELAVPHRTEAESGEPWAGSVDAAFTGATGAAAEPTPYAWESDAIEALSLAGPSVREYFHTLLGWQPGAVQESPQGVSAASASPAWQPEAEPDGGEVIEEEWPWSSPGDRSGEPPPESSEGTELLLDTEGDWLPDGAEEIAATEASGVISAENEPGAPAADTEEPMPWEIPAAAQPAAAETKDPPPDRGDAGDGAEDEDDEDLEMFRSWLQSLKK